MEKWVDIIGFNNEYQVSDLGRIKSIKNGLIMKLNKKSNGYVTIKLCKNGKGFYFLVHRLVMSNFIDNIDGASSGILIISSFTLAIIARQEKDDSLYLISIILAGACLGFIFWNWHPAKIYLGDAGSYFLGSIIALISLLLDPTKLNFPVNILLLILIFAVPLIDTCVAIISRIRRRAPIYIGGRDHFSHRFLRLGFTTRSTTIILLLTTLVFNFLAIILYLYSDRYFELILLTSTILFLSSIIYLLSLPDED